MDRLGNLVRIAILLSLAVLLLGGVLLVMGPERFAAWLPRRPLPEMDLRHLAADKRGVLACSPGLCAEGTVDLVIEPVDMPVDELRRRLLAFVDHSPEVTLLDVAPDGQQWRFRVMVPGEAVPDVVVVRMAPRAHGRTALAIYSTAMGWGVDHARQQQRVRRWLAILRPAKEQAGQKPVVEGMAATPPMRRVRLFAKRPDKPVTFAHAFLTPRRPS